jgi:hypothetical protein
MKQSAILLGVLGVLFCLCAVHAQAQDPSTPKPTDSIAPEQAFDSLLKSVKQTTGSATRAETDRVNSVCELHDWFDQQLMNLHRDYYSRGNGYRLTPIGIYSTHDLRSLEKTKYWNFGAEYHLPLNTINGFFTGFSYDFAKVRAYARVFFGAGVGKIEGLDSLETEATSNWGVNGELEFRGKSIGFNPLLGLSYVWVNPDIGSDGQGNYLYAGNRFFFTSERAFSLDLRGGVAFWRGFDEETPPGWFVSGGLTVHRMVNFAKVGKPLFAPVEVSLMGNIPLELISSKVMFPLRLRKGISFAPFGSYGIESGSNLYSAAYGLGAEFRLFGDEINSGLNPYTGFQYYWLHQFPGTGEGSSFYFGARLYLTDYVAIDGNLGPIFWREDTPEDEDLEDWVGQIGITVAFGKVREKNELSGAVLIQENTWGNSRYDQMADGPLDDEGLHRYDGEVRVYAAEECREQEPPPPVALRTGDLTDLKFYTMNLDFDLAMDPFSTSAGLLSEAESKDRDVFIVVLFNKKHTVVGSLNETNTFFHFLDMDNNQYFGYRWDANRSRQPEFRKYDTLGVMANRHTEMYWGSYDEFVKPMSWLDEQTVMDFVNGQSVQDKILRTLGLKFTEDDSLLAGTPTPEERLKLISDNYRIGYVKYPQSTLDKLKGFLDYRSLGAAVMYCADRNPMGLYVKAKDARWMDSIPRGIDPEAIVRFDAADDFSFSNHVRMDEILSEDLVLDHFAECSPILSDMHKQTLEDAVVPQLRANPNLKVTLLGYADATPMSPECRDIYQNDGQRLLAGSRAQNVANYLTSRGIESDRITVEAMGVKPPYRNRTPEDRCVIIKFIY